MASVPDLPDLVALSLLPSWTWRLAAERLRAGGAVRHVLEELIASRRQRPDQRLDACANAPRRRSHRAGERGIAAIPWSDAAYPAALATIVDPPFVLWTRGLADALERPAVAMVGSRAASPYGLAVAERLAADLAARGIVVVSGLARGVDSAAHRGALAGGGATVAVLGSGADVIYPPEHASLAREIESTGARPERARARHAAAAVVLSDAQPHHQRPGARRRRHRSRRKERVAHHRAAGARSGPRRPGGPGQRAERPKPRRPCASARRGKDCGGRGRYSGRARDDRNSGRESFCRRRRHKTTPIALRKTRFWPV